MYLPENVSGGQRQRANIARGLNKKCDIILADEPTSNLDMEKAEEMMQLIVNSCESCIVTVHDKSLLRFFNKVVYMENGRIIK